MKGHDIAAKRPFPPLLKEVVDIHVYILVGVGYQKFVAVVYEALRQKRGAGGALGDTVYLHHLKLIAGGVFKYVVEIIFFVVFPLAYKNEFVLALRAQIVYDHLDHRLAPHVYERLGEGVTGSLKARSPPGHRYENIEHAGSILLCMTHVITHRGLDPARGEGYFAESSYEAFEDQLRRGFGIEFDPRADLLVAHDDLSRTTKNGCHTASLKQVAELISNLQAPGAISALHLKHRVQEKGVLDALLPYFENFDPSKFFIFDATLETAAYLKEKKSALVLGASVAHPYDIECYGNATGGTLYTAEEILLRRDLFDWVTLDEWDRARANGEEKALYTAETFKQLRSAGFKICVISPELHATSPGLLGGEAHPDAKDHATLIARIKEILALSPDAICTDYPDEVQSLLN